MNHFDYLLPFCAFAATGVLNTPSTVRDLTISLVLAVWTCQTHSSVRSHVWCFLLVFYSNFVPEIFDFKNATRMMGLPDRQRSLTLKTGLGVRQGHWKCHHSIERIMTSY